MPHCRLAPLAQNDLEEIGLYVAMDDYDASLRLVERFFRAFDLLADSPKMGRNRPELGGVRSFPFRPYVIFYREAHEGVEIARVLHGARDIPSLLEDS
ncbi:MAG TPA: type II toxin-antitoxin system RelE/ParE family toxin [Sumerlaeia bacterium]|nr:type II toxin-antitoxin system RelE/ParE family toxin [Sumerlaeia bacterium]